MFEFGKEIWKKDLEERMEKTFMLAEKTNEYIQIEKQRKKITKSNNIKKILNKMPFVNLKLKELPELPKLKMVVLRPTIEVKE